LGSGVASATGSQPEGIRTEKALERLVELLESLTADSSRQFVRSVRDAAAEGVGSVRLADVFAQQDEPRS
jgi:hypothetical protein